MATFGLILFFISVVVLQLGSILRFARKDKEPSDFIATWIVAAIWFFGDMWAISTLALRGAFA